MLEKYPKEIILQDGGQLTVRPMQMADQDALYRFFIQLTEADRRYLRNDITSRIIIEQWCRHLNFEKVLPIIAKSEKDIVANATLHRDLFGWSKHIGEIRITVAQDFQKRGLGPILVDEITELAKEAGLEKLCARIVSSRDYVVKAFESIGFYHQTTLKKYIKSIHDNSYKDIAVLVKDLKSTQTAAA
jgi:N-acetylglutamate synthase-like GNAT family acetyltransferase